MVPPNDAIRIKANMVEPNMIQKDLISVNTSINGKAIKNRIAADV
jgi:hypothetical protein